VSRCTPEFAERAACWTRNERLPDLAFVSALLVTIDRGHGAELRSTLQGVAMMSYMLITRSFTPSESVFCLSLAQLWLVLVAAGNLCNQSWLYAPSTI
jgi:hypothetical protein